MSISYTVQQLSVFLENRAGRLDDVLKVLSEGGVNIVALSLADTADYGMLRMIVSKAMHQLVEGEINIEYMYAFANGIDAAAVLKSDEPGRVVDILTGCGFTVYSADEAYSANV